MRDYALKTVTEMKIVEFLKSGTRAIVSEITAGIKVDRGNCGKTLKRLVEMGILEVSEEFGRILYSAVSESSTPARATPLT